MSYFNFKFHFNKKGAVQGHEALNPTSPYVAPIHHGAQPGRMIQIQGQIPHHARR
jgi:hypothetical protein